MAGRQGWVYLICLEEPIGVPGVHTARHYIGFTEYEDPETRLERHRAGKGGRMLRAATLRGIHYEIVRTWRGTRALERELKNRRNHSRLCPNCREEHNERANRARRERYAREKQERRAG